MMIRVKWAMEASDVLAQISMGLKGKTATFSLEDRGTLVMAAEEWKLFRQALERGAGKGVIVVIEEAELPKQKQASKDEKPIF